MRIGMFMVWLVLLFWATGYTLRHWAEVVGTWRAWFLAIVLTVSAASVDFWIGMV